MNYLLDLHSARVIPYWDLVTIAKYENAKIPNHVLGKALFPDEVDVDITERIRKVTKRKSNNVFSDYFITAIIAQLDKIQKQEQKHT